MLEVSYDKAKPAVNEGAVFTGNDLFDEAAT
jgi:hypothetical protein